MCEDRGELSLSEYWFVLVGPSCLEPGGPLVDVKIGSDDPVRRSVEPVRGSGRGD